ncbi:hypothetical protein RRG08_020244 [Elysia crispata]|uniref:Uncharacterized protein n=1 Tax=Elysia crispata TaxID=231223 RepID=A0AAE1A283_9GAST|nr:hypothetical protein RRG08_020244 [Elysia crispata]
MAETLKCLTLPKRFVAFPATERCRVAPLQTTVSKELHKRVPTLINQLGINGNMRLVPSAYRLRSAQTRWLPSIISGTSRQVSMDTPARPVCVGTWCLDI